MKQPTSREKMTWNLWGYKVQDGNHQSWEGDGPYWIGAGARLANCTFGEKNASDAARFDFLGLDFFKWFLHIKNVKRYVMIYILMDERELRLSKKRKRQIHWKIPTEMATQGQQRRWESRLRNVTWFPVERWLDLPLCEGFQYVVTLREPVPRVLHQHLEGKECMWHHVTPIFLRCMWLVNTGDWRPYLFKTWFRMSWITQKCQESHFVYFAWYVWITQSWMKHLSKPHVVCHPSVPPLLQRPGSFTSSRTSENLWVSWLGSLLVFKVSYWQKRMMYHILQQQMHVKQI